MCSFSLPYPLHTTLLMGEVKCNVDATIFKYKNWFCTSMCVRDKIRQFIYAQMVWNNGKLNPQEAKAWGPRQTLTWLLNLGFSRVAIDLDNRSVVDYISSKLGHKSEFSAILSACKNLMFSLPNCRLNFIGWQANNVTHLLPRATLSYTSHH